MKNSKFATCPNDLHDGLWVVAAGTIWTFAGRSVDCFAPDGSPIGEVRIGGHRRSRLNICARAVEPACKELLAFLPGGGGDRFAMKLAQDEAAATCEVACDPDPLQPSTTARLSCRDRKAPRF